MYTPMHIVKHKQMFYMDICYLKFFNKFSCSIWALTPQHSELGKVYGEQG